MAGWWRLVLLSLPPLLFHLYIDLPQRFDGFDAALVRGQRVVVCGASMGIGEELVYQYARLGAHVVAIARSESALQRVTAKAREFGAASATPVVADLGSLAGARDALSAAMGTDGFAGGMDVLVLNHIIGFWGWILPENITSAGKHVLGGVSDRVGSFEFMEKMMQVNALSFMNLAVLGAPALVRSGSERPKIGGRLVVVSSLAAKLGLPKVAPYSASKHALHGFFDSLRIEIVAKQLPVTVTICTLGLIATESARAQTAGDLKNTPTASPADETAMAILRAGATGQREIFHPLSQGVHIVSLLRPLMPSFMDRVLLALAL